VKIKKKLNDKKKEPTDVILKAPSWML